jgi:hypothetical protein
MLFNGIAAPRVITELAIGGTTPLDPDAAAFVLGTSQLGTGQLGDLGWVDLGDAVTAIGIDPGATSSLDDPVPARCRIEVDNFSGTWDADNPGSPFYGQLEVGIPVRVRAELATVASAGLYPGAALYPAGSLFPDPGGPAPGVRYGLFRGYLDEITPDYGADPTVTFAATDQLGGLGRVKVPEITPAFDGDLTGQRISRILDLAGVPTSLRAVDPGRVQCQADTWGDWALALAARVVVTEMGELWVDGDGVVQFFDRLRVYLAPRSTTVQATFSDLGVDVEMTGMTASRRRGVVFNEAHITRVDGEEQIAADAVSQARYGPQTYPGAVGTLLRSDTDALALAMWLVSRFAEPRTAFSAIEVDATCQGMWQVLLPLRRFDRIRVVRDYGPRTIDVELLVESIGHSITEDSWSMIITTRAGDTFIPVVLGTSRLDTGELA